MPNAFDRNHAFYRLVQQLTSLRQSQPPLRYGRQYFRPLSGDGVHFGISPFPSGVLAFSRILQDQEIVIVANTNTQSSWAGEVIVDFSINPVSSNYQAIFSNKAGDQVVSPGSVIEKAASSVEVREVDGSVNHGPLRVLPVTLQPMEIQIMCRTN
jgi:hypothetical protein